MFSNSQTPVVTACLKLSRALNEYCTVNLFPPVFFGLENILTTSRLMESIPIRILVDSWNRLWSESESILESTPIRICLDSGIDSHQNPSRLMESPPTRIRESTPESNSRRRRCVLAWCVQCSTRYSQRYMTVINSALHLTSVNTLQAHTLNVHASKVITL